MLALLATSLGGPRQGLPERLCSPGPAMSYDVTEELQIALREFLDEIGPEASRRRSLAEDLERELSTGEAQPHG